MLKNNPKLRDALYTLSVVVNAMVVSYQTEKRLNLAFIVILGGFNALVGIVARDNISAGKE